MGLNLIGTLTMFKTMEILPNFSDENVNKKMYDGR